MYWSIVAIDVDYNRELAVPNAVMYAVQATVGFMPCGTSVVTCLLMRDLGGTTKLAPLVALVLFGADYGHSEQASHSFT